LHWARIWARGESVRSFCLESGWNRSTFYCWRQRTLEKVAATLNAEKAARSPLRLPARIANIGIDG
jgi:hypothetical protein